MLEFFTFLVNHEDFLFVHSIHSKNYYRVISPASSWKSKKISSYTPYYAQACRGWRGPTLRHSTWAAQLQKTLQRYLPFRDSVPNLTSPENEPGTFRFKSDAFNYCAKMRCFAMSMGENRAHIVSFLLKASLDCFCLLQTSFVLFI